MNFEICGITDIGCCMEENQDAFLIDTDFYTKKAHLEIEKTINGDFFLAVADGVGSAEDGSFAAAAALEFLADADANENLQNLLTRMNDRVIFRAISAGVDTAATIAGIVSFLGEITIFNIGDSRVYGINNGYLEKLTIDDNVVDIFKKQNIYGKPPLIQVLGSENIFVHTKKSLAEDFLICTDGLTDLLDIDEIENLLKTGKNLQQKAAILVNAAKSKGGYDNISLILASVVR